MFLFFKNTVKKLKFRYTFYLINNYSTPTRIFWGELIDKYKDINANSKIVFTDYAMLKLVLYSPRMFLLFCQSKVGVVKKNSGAKCFI